MIIYTSIHFCGIRCLYIMCLGYNVTKMWELKYEVQVVLMALLLLKGNCPESIVT